MNQPRRFSHLDQDATNAVENIFFLLSQLTRDFQESSGAAATAVEA